MAISKLKKMAALLTMTAVVVAAVPEVSRATGTDATSETTGTEVGSDGAEAGDSEAGGAAEGEEGGSQQQVDEDGEVVQEGALGKVDKEDWITIKDYELITESDTYKLYLYSPRLSIILENKETGEILESTLSDEKDDGNSNASWNAYMKSGIVLTAIIGDNTNYQADLIITDNDVNVTKKADGFSAAINFKGQYNFGLTVDVTLDNDNLIVTIPDDSIHEDPNGAYISTISLFPFMGYTFLDDEEGYMLVPDGNGALIYLDNKEGRYPTGFSQMIYGGDVGFDESTTKDKLWDKIEIVKDSNKVLAPVFGMAHTKQQLAYLAVVESGDERAYIEVQPNGATVNYNRCFARFLMRNNYVQPLNNSNSGVMTRAEADRTHTDLTVRYMLLSGENANYSAMANSYRDYLLNTGQLTKRDASYNTRVDFLGTEREDFLLSTRAVTMTTVEDLEEIFAQLQDKGVQSLFSTYKGWQKGGLYDLPISKYKADSHIGGTSKLTKFIKDSAEKNYQVYLYNDALRINPSTNRMNFDMIRKINKRTYVEELWAEVYDEFYFQMPAKTKTVLSGFVDSYTSDGVSNLAVAGISNTLFSYSQRGKFYSRKGTADAFEEMLAGVDEKTNLALEQPVAYLWKNADVFLDMPLGTSDYIYLDEEIPFLAMVLKGIVPMYSDYVNFEANKQEFLLLMIESGIFPSFYLTKENSSDLIYTNSSDLYSTEYSTYMDSVVAFDRTLRSLNKDTEGALIVKHERLENGVTAVTYDNGVVIYVNYTGETQQVNGETLDVNSFSYTKAGDLANE